MNIFFTSGCHKKISFSFQFTLFTPKPQQQRNLSPAVPPRVIVPPVVESSAIVPPVVAPFTVTPPVVASPSAALPVAVRPMMVAERIAEKNAERPKVVSVIETSEEMPEDIPPPPEFFTGENSDPADLSPSELSFLPVPPPPEEYSTDTVVVPPSGGQHVSHRQTKGCNLELIRLNFYCSQKS
jgi:hypothetical protein